jgi:DNA primase
LELFVAQQVDLQILTLPEGNDPCDFLRQHGAEAFAELLAHGAVDALDHAFRMATEGVDLQRDVHAASAALERLVTIVARAPRLRGDTTREDRFREEKILQRLAASFRVDEQEIRRRMTALRRRSSSRAPFGRPPEVAGDNVEGPPPERIDSAERELIELLMGHPECLPAARSELAVEQLSHPHGRQVYEAMCRLADDGVSPSFERLMLQFDQPAVKSLLVEMDEEFRAKGDREAEPEALILEIVHGFQRREARRRRPGQIVALRDGTLDDGQETELLEEIIRQERNRQGISEPTDG